MKVVILCGGLGTRLREETEFRPKAMVEIGGRPILWHIMKHYAHYGYTEFVLCLGYKGDVIRDYFYNYEIRNRDFTITLGTREIEIHNNHTESNWKITLAETGEHTLTGGRLKRIAHYINSARFMVTYGDGVANIDIRCLRAFHEEKGMLGTITAVRPSSRFGELSIDDGIVGAFREKPQVAEGWINGGFFVFQREVLDMINGDDESLEQGLLATLTSSRQLAVYQHYGFWQCMDTYRERELLNELWQGNKPPWAVWREYDTSCVLE
ncbi:MAG: glucose-1-phosphate cytidylyltransferase [Ignavibacteriae bacterium]|nr:glucose-1-phosphate cytidylyltransferase [Ignavibacteriota bacterium]